MIIDRNDRTAYWLAIDIANNAGKDKLSFEDRILWVQENFDNIFDIDAHFDSPWECRNAVQALRKHLNGETIAHRVYLDASNQALQLYAVLTGDRKTALTCNLANGSTMADAYQMLADSMNKKLEGIIVLTRTNCKFAVMTTMYGKADGSLEIIKDVMQHISDPTERVEAFAKKYNMTMDTTKRGIAFVTELTTIFKESFAGIAPKALMAMEALTELNSTLVANQYTWTLPDGFKVKYRVRKDIPIESKKFETKKGFPITLPEMNKVVYDRNENSRAMSPNVVHSVDGFVAREMIRRMNGKYITTIHDAFACHPSHCDMMIQNYKDILCEMLTGTLLQDIIQSISIESTFTKNTDLTCEDIQNSMYLLA